MDNRIVVLMLATLTLAGAGSAATPVGWINGDFELGGQTWTVGPGTSFGDADADGDQEAILTACIGDFGLARGASKGVLPATTPLTFEIETGSLLYDIRMIVVDAQDPQPWANNLFASDVTGTLEPDWFDDQVLIWNEWTPQSGAVVLDPLEADAVNIDGWNDMDADARSARLGSMLHMTVVMYACTSGATIDDVAWVL